MVASPNGACTSGWPAGAPGTPRLRIGPRAHRLRHALPAGLIAIIELLRRQRWSTPQLAFHLALPPSTVGAVCRRLGLGRLAPTRPAEPANRYERRNAGELVHLDIKPLVRFHQPGHRATGDRRHGKSERAGWEYLHVAIDDASRLAYAEVLDAQDADACAGFLQRALAWFAARDITVRRIMTDNGASYLARRFQQMLTSYGVAHKRTRPYRPRTNGKAERFIRILLDEWAYRVAFTSSAHSRDALPAYLHYYNHHRPHGSLNHASPGQRLHELNNATSSYT